MNPDKQGLKALLDRVSQKAVDNAAEADRLREINAELLDALKAIQGDLEAHDNALTDTAHKRELLAIASETARAAIAKAEGTDR